MNPARQTRSIRVLLAPGESRSGRLLAHALENEASIDFMGVCETARDTLQSVRELSPDVLLLDWDLPGADIRFLLRQLRKRQDLRTVLLTGRVFAQDLVDAVALGAAGALAPDSRAEILVKCIHLVAAGEYWFQRRLTRVFIDSIPDTPETDDRDRVTDERLTPRETDVMQAVARGKTNREIAEELGMSEHTVKQHLKRVFGKLEVSSRVELVLRVTGHSR